MEEKENAHKKHRSRLKTKVKNHGLECLAYHEILEYLLTYTIPRKDTNPIAHNLIERFGSFANVIDANYFDLLKVDGIGPESALFLNSMFQLMEVYNKNKLETKVTILNSTTACVQFFRDFYSIKNNEFMVLACLGKNKKVLKTYVYKGKDETEINFDLKQIANNINDNGVKSVVLYHTHPNGSVEPSYSDYQTTQRIVNVCMINGIDFDDHIILNETEHFSFNHHNKLDELKNKYFSLVSVDNMFYNKKVKGKIEVDKE